jgi:hypothetical protein
MLEAAINQAGALKDAEIERLRAVAYSARNVLKWAINYDSDDKIMATAIRSIDAALEQIEGNSARLPTVRNRSAAGGRASKR